MRSVKPLLTLTTVLVGLGIVAGITREVLLARLLGTGPELEQFRLAFAIPNLFATSLGATLVAALVPFALTNRDDDEGEADALRRLSAASLILGAILAATGAATAHWQAALLAPGFDETRRDALSAQIAWLWGYFALVASTFGVRAFLSARSIIWPAASIGLVLGGTMALGLGVLTVFPATKLDANGLVILAIGAALVLLAVHIRAVPSRLWRLAASRNGTTTGGWTWRMGWAAIVAVAAHSISSAPRLIDRAIGTELAPGVVAALDFSFAVITVPGLIFGTALATALLPGLAAARASGDRRLEGSSVSWILAVSIVAGIVGLGIAAGSTEIVDLLFRGGAFDATSADMTARLLSWHAGSLGPMVASFVLFQVLLVRGQLMLLLVVASARVAAKWLAVHLLVPEYGLDGLAASFLAPEIVSTMLLATAAWLTRGVRGR